MLDYYDIAPITITPESKVIKYTQSCDMPNLGSLEFTLYKTNNGWLMKYGEYPLVKCAVGSNLFLGIGQDVDVRIVPNSIDKVLGVDNINSFSIAVGHNE